MGHLAAVASIPKFIVNNNNNNNTLLSPLSYHLLFTNKLPLLLNGNVFAPEPLQLCADTSHQ